MSDLPIALVKRKPLFSPVWLVPFLCLLMLGYFASRHIKSMGPEITILFDDAENLVPGKTQIRYLGVPVGRVLESSIDYEKKKVKAVARLDRSAASLAREGTTFLVVKPEVNFQGVRGLTTIFSGSWLTLRAGEGDPASEFKGYANAREAFLDEPGLIVHLITQHVGAADIGDPVLYRGFKVGEILESSLSPSGQNVILRIKVDSKYDQFVRANSKFWEASGLQAKIGLFGARVSVNSMDALLRGAVAFATPDEPGSRVKSGAEFTLAPRAEPAWEKWSPSLRKS